MDEDEESNEQPPKYGFWESWGISFKKNQFTADIYMGIIIFIGVLICGGVLLLETLVSWLSNG
tara:strand:- start:207 stop:395 length:189 start_codon:yes stop_codon:yes gene_type:complete